ncbi:uncharacterized protein [Dasypus novemcinctus]|uniref:uncharacterized protein n=1 Tax=Dasypus novemcinctus TaxID=9361 RepID=UPI0039C91C28
MGLNPVPGHRAPCESKQSEGLGPAGASPWPSTPLLASCGSGAGRPGDGGRGGARALPLLALALAGPPALAAAKQLRGRYVSGGRAPSAPRHPAPAGSEETVPVLQAHLASQVQNWTRRSSRRSFLSPKSTGGRDAAREAAERSCRQGRPSPAAARPGAPPTAARAPAQPRAPLRLASRAIADAPALRSLLSPDGCPRPPDRAVAGGRGAGRGGARERPRLPARPPPLRPERAPGDSLCVDTQICLLLTETRARWLKLGEPPAGESLTFPPHSPLHPDPLHPPSLYPSITQSRPWAVPWHQAVGLTCPGAVPIPTRGKGLPQALFKSLSPQELQTFKKAGDAIEESLLLKDWSHNSHLFPSTWGLREPQRWERPVALEAELALTLQVLEATTDSALGAVLDQPLHTLRRRPLRSGRPGCGLWVAAGPAAGLRPQGRLRHWLRRLHEAPKKESPSCLEASVTFNLFRLLLWDLKCVAGGDLCA